MHACIYSYILTHICTYTCTHTQTQQVQRFINTFRDDFGEAQTKAYVHMFQQEAVDGAALLGLTSADLESMGVSNQGHRALLLSEIESHLLSTGSRAPRCVCVCMHVVTQVSHRQSSSGRAAARRA